MLIIGFRVIWRTLRSGMFRCPNENADRPYSVQEARRFFTIFFLPVIPLTKAGEAVRCDSCKNRFPLSVLDTPAVEDRTAAVAAAARTAAVAMAAADGGPGADAATRVAAIDFVNAGVSSSSADYDDVKLAEDLRLLPIHDVRSIVEQAAPALDPNARESFVARLAAVASVNAPMTAAERRVIDGVATGLGLTPAHLRGVLTPGD